MQPEVEQERRDSSQWTCEKRKEKALEKKVPASRKKKSNVAKPQVDEHVDQDTMDWISPDLDQLDFSDDNEDAPPIAFPGSKRSINCTDQTQEDVSNDSLAVSPTSHASPPSSTAFMLEAPCNSTDSFTQYPAVSAEDLHMGRVAAALLIPERPTLSLSDRIHWARVRCMAQQRVQLLSCLQEETRCILHYDRLQMLLYADQECLSHTMGVPRTSMLARRTEASLDDQRCAAFLVCMAACLLPRASRSWYVECETLLAHGVYQALCCTSSAQQCAHEQVSVEWNMHDLTEDGTYHALALEHWTTLASRRVQCTIERMQNVLYIDPETGIVDDTRAMAIPKDTEDALCDLKALLLQAYEQHQRNTSDDYGFDVTHNDPEMMSA